MDDVGVTKLASHLWQSLIKLDQPAADERSNELVARLVKALDLPTADPTSTPVVIPTDQIGAMIFLEPEEDHYIAKAAQGADSGREQVVIPTRRGPVVVESDHPLAQAQRGLERLKKL